MFIRTPHGAFTDPLIRTLNEQGIASRLWEPGRPEEFAGLAVGGQSTGIVGVDAWPLRWINLQANLTYQSGRPDWFMLLYGVPDERITERFEGIEIQGRGRSRTSMGRQASPWQTKTGWRRKPNTPFAREITRRLNDNGELCDRFISLGVNITVTADHIVNCWVVAGPVRGNLEDVLPSRSAIKFLQLLGEELLGIEIPGDYRAIRLSGRAPLTGNVGQAPAHSVEGRRPAGHGLAPAPRTEENGISATQVFAAVAVVTAIIVLLTVLLS